MSVDDRMEMLNRVFQQKYGLVRSIARRYAPAPDLTDDIVQQTYLDFVRAGLEHAWDADTAAAVLCTIARRKALMLWKDRRRRKQCSIDEVRQRLVDDSALARSDETGPEDTLEYMTALQRCLDRLSEKARDFVRRHYYEGETIKRIGESEKVSMPSIYRFFRQIRLKLKDCIMRR